MSQDPSRSDHLAALEKEAACGINPWGRLVWWAGAGLVAVLVLAALVTGNIWLTKQEQARRQSTLEHDFWVVSHETYPARERAEAFLRLVAAGNREWRSARLDGLSLEGVSLPDTDLQRADFKDSKMARAVCTGARFAKSKFINTDLTQAELTKADLAAAELFKALLKGAQLRQANLRGAVLQQVDAPDASFAGANLCDAYLLMANLAGANFSAADLTGASLEAAVLKGANLSMARMSGVNLKDADLTDCNWWRARGLAAEQLALLIKNFPPTEQAAASLRDDYQTWLKKFEPVK